MSSSEMQTFNILSVPSRLRQYAECNSANPTSEVSGSILALQRLVSEELWQELDEEFKQKYHNDLKYHQDFLFRESIKEMRVSHTLKFWENTIDQALDKLTDSVSKIPLSHQQICENEDNFVSYIKLIIAFNEALYFVPYCDDILNQLTEEQKLDIQRFNLEDHEYDFEQSKLTDPASSAPSGSEQPLKNGNNKQNSVNEDSVPSLKSNHISLEEIDLPEHIKAFFTSKPIKQHNQQKRITDILNYKLDNLRLRDKITNRVNAKIARLNIKFLSFNSNQSRENYLKNISTSSESILLDEVYGSIDMFEDNLKKPEVFSAYVSILAAEHMLKEVRRKIVPAKITEKITDFQKVLNTKEVVDQVKECVDNSQNLKENSRRKQNLQKIVEFKEKLMKLKNYHNYLKKTSSSKATIVGKTISGKVIDLEQQVKEFCLPGQRNRRTWLSEDDELKECGYKWWFNYENRDYYTRQHLSQGQKRRLDQRYRRNALCGLYADYQRESNFFVLEQDSNDAPDTSEPWEPVSSLKEKKKAKKEATIEEIVASLPNYEPCVKAQVVCKQRDPSLVIKVKKMRAKRRNLELQDVPTIANENVNNCLIDEQLDTKDIPTDEMSQSQRAITLRRHFRQLQPEIFVHTSRADLFYKNTHMAHCVSADLEMSQGIAVQFKRRYGKLSELMAQDPQVGDVIYIKDDFGKYKFYLVTKQYYYEKPTYQTMEACLTRLKQLCQELKVDELHIPKIGCGLDKLEWWIVKADITQIFKSLNIQIYVHVPAKACIIKDFDFPDMDSNNLRVCNLKTCINEQDHRCSHAPETKQALEILEPTIAETLNSFFSDPIACMLKMKFGYKKSLKIWTEAKARIETKQNKNLTKYFGDEICEKIKVLFENSINKTREPKLPFAMNKGEADELLRIKVPFEMEYVARVGKLWTLDINSLVEIYSEKFFKHDSHITYVDEENAEELILAEGWKYCYQNVNGRNTIHVEEQDMDGNMLTKALHTEFDLKKKKDYKINYITYPDVVSKKFFGKIEGPLYLGSPDGRMVNVSKEKLITYGEDGETFTWQEANTFISKDLYISGTPVFNCLGEVCSVITKSKQMRSWHVYVLAGHYGARGRFSYENIEKLELTPGIWYAGMKFENKMELSQYVNDVKQLSPTTVILGTLNSESRIYLVKDGLELSMSYFDYSIADKEHSLNCNYLKNGNYTSSDCFVGQLWNKTFTGYVWCQCKCTRKWSHLDLTCPSVKQPKRHIIACRFGGARRPENCWFNNQQEEDKWTESERLLALGIDKWGNCSVHMNTWNKTYEFNCSSNSSCSIEQTYISGEQKLPLRNTSKISLPLTFKYVEKDNLIYVDSPKYHVAHASKFSMTHPDIYGKLSPINKNKKLIIGDSHYEYCISNQSVRMDVQYGFGEVVRSFKSKRHFISGTPIMQDGKVVSLITQSYYNGTSYWYAISGLTGDATDVKECNVMHMSEKSTGTKPKQAIKSKQTNSGEKTSAQPTSGKQRLEMDLAAARKAARIAKHKAQQSEDQISRIQKELSKLKLPRTNAPPNTNPKPPPKKKDKSTIVKGLLIVAMFLTTYFPMARADSVDASLRKIKDNLKIIDVSSASLETDPNSILHLCHQTHKEINDMLTQHLPNHKSNTIFGGINETKILLTELKENLRQSERKIGHLKKTVDNVNTNLETLHSKINEIAKISEKSKDTVMTLINREASIRRLFNRSPRSIADVLKDIEQSLHRSISQLEIYHSIINEYASNGATFRHKRQLSSHPPRNIDTQWHLGQQESDSDCNLLTSTVPFNDDCSVEPACSYNASEKFLGKTNSSCPLAYSNAVIDGERVVWEHSALTIKEMRCSLSCLPDWALYNLLSRQPKNWWCVCPLMKLLGDSLILTENTTEHFVLVYKDVIYLSLLDKAFRSTRTGKAPDKYCLNAGLAEYGQVFYTEGIFACKLEAPTPVQNIHIPKVIKQLFSLNYIVQNSLYILLTLYLCKHYGFTIAVIFATITFGIIPTLSLECPNDGYVQQISSVESGERIKKYLGSINLKPSTCVKIGQDRLIRFNSITATRTYNWLYATPASVGVACTAWSYDCPNTKNSACKENKLECLREAKKINELEYTWCGSFKTNPDSKCWGSGAMNVYVETRLNLPKNVSDYLYLYEAQMTNTISEINVTDSMVSTGTETSFTVKVGELKDTERDLIISQVAYVDYMVYRYIATYKGKYYCGHTIPTRDLGISTTYNKPWIPASVQAYRPEFKWDGNDVQVEVQNLYGTQFINQYLYECPSTYPVFKIGQGLLAKVPVDSAIAQIQAKSIINLSKISYCLKISTVKATASGGITSNYRYSKLVLSGVVADVCYIGVEVSPCIIQGHSLYTVNGMFELPINVLCGMLIPDQISIIIKNGAVLRVKIDGSMARDLDYALESSYVRVKAIVASYNSTWFSDVFDYVGNPFNLLFGMINIFVLLKWAICIVMLYFIFCSLISGNYIVAGLFLSLTSFLINIIPNVAALSQRVENIQEINDENFITTASAILTISLTTLKLNVLTIFLFILYFVTLNYMSYSLFSIGTIMILLALNLKVIQFLICAHADQILPTLAINARRAINSVVMVLDLPNEDQMLHFIEKIRILLTIVCSTYICCLITDSLIYFLLCIPGVLLLSFLLTRPNPIDEIKEQFLNPTRNVLYDVRQNSYISYIISAILPKRRHNELEPSVIQTYPSSIVNSDETLWQCSELILSQDKILTAAFALSTDSSLHNAWWSFVEKIGDKFIMFSMKYVPKEIISDQNRVIPEYWLLATTNHQKLKLPTNEWASVEIGDYKLWSKGLGSNINRMYHEFFTIIRNAELHTDENDEYSIDLKVIDITSAPCKCYQSANIVIVKEDDDILRLKKTPEYLPKTWKGFSGTLFRIKDDIIWVSKCCAGDSTRIYGNETWMSVPSLKVACPYVLDNAAGRVVATRDLDRVNPTMHWLDTHQGTKVNYLFDVDLNKDTSLITKETLNMVNRNIVLYRNEIKLEYGPLYLAGPNVRIVSSQFTKCLILGQKQNVCFDRGECYEVFYDAEMLRCQGVELMIARDDTLYGTVSSAFRDFPNNHSTEEGLATFAIIKDYDSINEDDVEIKKITTGYKAELRKNRYFFCEDWEEFCKILNIICDKDPIIYFRENDLAEALSNIILELINFNIKKNITIEFRLTRDLFYDDDVSAAMALYLNKKGVMELPLNYFEWQQVTESVISQMNYKGMPTTADVSTDCINLLDVEKPPFMVGEQFFMAKVSSTVSHGRVHGVGTRLGSNYHVIKEANIIYTNANSIGRDNSTSSVLWEKNKKVNEITDICRFNWEDGKYLSAPQMNHMYCVLDLIEKQKFWVKCIASDANISGLNGSYAVFRAIRVNFTTNVITPFPLDRFPGLSGSPILDQNGDIVGIYGLLSSKLEGREVVRTVLSAPNSEIARYTSYFEGCVQEMSQTPLPPDKLYYVVEAPTGTGKTTTFSLAALNSIANGKTMLILEPTVDAANAAYGSFVSICKFMKKERDWTIKKQIGSKNVKADESYGRGPKSVIVQTAGKFNVSYNRMLPACEIVIVDEAHMREDQTVLCAQCILSDKDAFISKYNIKVVYMTATDVGLKEHGVELGKIGRPKTTKYDVTSIVLQRSQPEDGPSYIKLDLKKLGGEFVQKTNTKWKHCYKIPVTDLKTDRTIIFTHSKKTCESIANYIRHQLTDIDIIPYYAGCGLSPASFPKNCIIVATDVLGVSVTIDAVSTIVDLRTEIKPEVDLNVESSEEYYYCCNLVCRNTSPQIWTQRKGRGGRTCRTKYYYLDIEGPQTQMWPDNVLPGLAFEYLQKMGATDANMIKNVAEKIRFSEVRDFIISKFIPLCPDNTKIPKDRWLAAGNACGDGLQLYLQPVVCFEWYRKQVSESQSDRVAWQQMSSAEQKAWIAKYMKSWPGFKGPTPAEDGGALVRHNDHDSAYDNWILTMQTMKKSAISDKNQQVDAMLNKLNISRVYQHEEEVYPGPLHIKGVKYPGTVSATKEDCLELAVPLIGTIATVIGVGAITTFAINKHGVRYMQDVEVINRSSVATACVSYREIDPNWVIKADLLSEIFEKIKATVKKLFKKIKRLRLRTATSEDSALLIFESIHAWCLANIGFLINPVAGASFAAGAAVGLTIDRFNYLFGPILGGAMLLIAIGTITVFGGLVPALITTITSIIVYVVSSIPKYDPTRQQHPYERNRGGSGPLLLVSSALGISGALMFDQLILKAAAALTLPTIMPISNVTTVTSLGIVGGMMPSLMATMKHVYHLVMEVFSGRCRVEDLLTTIVEIARAGVFGSIKSVILITIGVCILALVRILITWYSNKKVEECANLRNPDGYDRESEKYRKIPDWFDSFVSAIAVIGDPTSLISIILDFGVKWMTKDGGVDYSDLKDSFDTMAGVNIFTTCFSLIVTNFCRMMTRIVEHDCALTVASIVNVLIGIPISLKLYYESFVEWLSSVKCKVHDSGGFWDGILIRRSRYRIMIGNISSYNDFKTELIAKLTEQNLIDQEKSELISYIEQNTVNNNISILSEEARNALILAAYNLIGDMYKQEINLSNAEEKRQFLNLFLEYIKMNTTSMIKKILNGIGNTIRNIYNKAKNFLIYIKDKIVAWFNMILNLCTNAKKNISDGLELIGRKLENHVARGISKGIWELLPFTKKTPEISPVFEQNTRETTEEILDSTSMKNEVDSFVYSQCITSPGPANGVVGLLSAIRTETLTGTEFHLTHEELNGDVYYGNCILPWPMGLFSVDLASIPMLLSGLYQAKYENNKLNVYINNSKIPFEVTRVNVKNSVEIVMRHPCCIVVANISRHDNKNSKLQICVSGTGSSDVSIYIQNVSKEFSGLFKYQELDMKKLDSDMFKDDSVPLVVYSAEGFFMELCKYITLMKNSTFTMRMKKKVKNLSNAGASLIKTGLSDLSKLRNQDKAVVTHLRRIGKFMHESLYLARTVREAICERRMAVTNAISSGMPLAEICDKVLDFQQDPQLAKNWVDIGKETLIIIGCEQNQAIKNEPDRIYKHPITGHIALVGPATNCWPNVEQQLERIPTMTGNASEMLNNIAKWASQTKITCIVQTQSSAYASAVLGCCECVVAFFIEVGEFYVRTCEDHIFSQHEVTQISMEAQRKWIKQGLDKELYYKLPEREIQNPQTDIAPLFAISRDSSSSFESLESIYEFGCSAIGAVADIFSKVFPGKSSEKQQETLERVKYGIKDVVPRLQKIAGVLSGEDKMDWSQYQFYDIEDTETSWEDIVPTFIKGFETSNITSANFVDWHESLLSKNQTKEIFDHNLTYDDVYRLQTVARRKANSLPVHIKENVIYYDRVKPPQNRESTQTYVSGSAIKLQEIHELIPNLFDNCEVIWDPMCGAGGFEQYCLYLGTQPAQQKRKIFHSTLNAPGHEQIALNLLQCDNTQTDIIQVNGNGNNDIRTETTKQKYKNLPKPDLIFIDAYEGDHNCSVARNWPLAITKKNIPSVVSQPEYNSFATLYNSGALKDEYIPQYRVDDILKSDTSVPILHCISRDAKMTQGLAQKMPRVLNSIVSLDIDSEKFLMNDSTLRDNDWVITTLDERPIINLITKEKHFDKPSYCDLYNRLNALFHRLRDKNIQKICCPAIGCGLDEREWTVISRMLYFFVRRYGVQVLVIDQEVLDPTQEYLLEESYADAISWFCEQSNPGAKLVLRMSGVHDTTIYYWANVLKHYHRIKIVRLPSANLLSPEFYVIAQGFDLNYERKNLESYNQITSSIVRKLYANYENCNRVLSNNRLKMDKYRTRYDWFSFVKTQIDYKKVTTNYENEPDGFNIKIPEYNIDITWLPNWKIRKEKILNLAQQNINPRMEFSDYGTNWNALYCLGTYNKAVNKFQSDRYISNGLISEGLLQVFSINRATSAYGATQSTQESTYDSYRTRLDRNPGAPDKRYGLELIQAMELLKTEHAKNCANTFKILTKDEARAMVNNKGAVGKFDTDGTLSNWIEKHPNWYEDAITQRIVPWSKNIPTDHYMTIRNKKETKQRKDATSEGLIMAEPGTSEEKLIENSNMVPRQITFADALTRLAQIILLGKLIHEHGQNKLYKGSITGIPPQYQGRILNELWNMQNNTFNEGYQDITDTSIELIDREFIQGNVSAAMLDFSKFDFTQTIFDRFAESNWYSSFYKDDWVKKAIMGMAGEFAFDILINDHGDIIGRQGMRSSGELPTSAGNTLQALSHIAVASSRVLNIPMAEILKTRGYMWYYMGGSQGPTTEQKQNMKKEAIRNRGIIKNDIEGHKKFKMIELTMISSVADGDDMVMMANRNIISKLVNGLPKAVTQGKKVLRSGDQCGVARCDVFEELTFCSHSYHPVVISQISLDQNYLNMDQNIKAQVRRGDKLYYLQTRNNCLVLGKLLGTLKAITHRFVVGDNEATKITRGKLLSYLLLYPHQRVIRSFCLAGLSILGEGEFNMSSNWRLEFVEELSKTVKGAMFSLYGVTNLDNISFIDYKEERRWMLLVKKNASLIGRNCPTRLREIDVAVCNWARFSKFNVNGLDLSVLSMSPHLLKIYRHLTGLSQTPSPIVINKTITHIHECPSCKKLYYSTHFVRRLDHSPLQGECPNVNCENYNKNKNFKNVLLPPLKNKTNPLLLTRLLIYAPPGSGKTTAISKIRTKYPRLIIGDTDIDTFGNFDILFTNKPELLAEYPSIKIQYQKDEWDAKVKSKCHNWLSSWFNDSEMHQPTIYTRSCVGYALTEIMEITNDFFGPPTLSNKSIAQLQLKQMEDSNDLSNWYN